MKKALIPSLILLLAAASWGQETIKHDGTQANIKHVSESGPNDQKQITHVSSKSGSALLDLFIVNMRDMSEQGSSDSIDQRLQEMMLAAKKAREANEIDGVFYYRFNRLLAVTKLVTVTDPRGILAPVILDVLGNFVLDKLGHDEFRAGRSGAISHVAAALSAEIIDLQIYLQTAKQREALQQSLQEKMTGAPKK